MRTINVADLKTEAKAVNREMRRFRILIAVIIAVAAVAVVLVMAH